MSNVQLLLVVRIQYPLKITIDLAHLVRVWRILILSNPSFLALIIQLRPVKHKRHHVARLRMQQHIPVHIMPFARRLKRSTKAKGHFLINRINNPHQPLNFERRFLTPGSLSPPPIDRVRLGHKHKGERLRELCPILEYLLIWRMCRCH